MQTSRVLIVLPIFNEIERIIRCIASLEKQDSNFVCVVSDNQSTDGTFELLKQRISQDPRFRLIQAKEHTSIISNSQNAFEYAFNNGIDPEYIMIFAGDDTLLSDNYLSVLTDWLDRNQDFSAVSPSIEMSNYSTKKKWVITPSLNSKLAFVRIAKWALNNSASGFTNFICGLMRKDAYIELQNNNNKNWNFETKSIDSRAIRSEFVTYLQFVINNRVGNCSQAIIQKEIHNRTNTGERILEPKPNKTSNNFKINALHQIKSMAIPFRASILFCGKLSVKETFMLVVFSILYFLTNFVSIITKKIDKEFTKFKVNY
jgi:glycosyltransferase involved in cell wall biosynthesis